MPTQEEITEAIKLLGFDPTTVQSMVVTADSVIGIAVDYPEPLDPPKEVSDGK